MAKLKVITQDTLERWYEAGDLGKFEVAWVSNRNIRPVKAYFEKAGIPHIVDILVPFDNVTYNTGIYVAKEDYEKSVDLTDQYVQDLTKRPLWFLQPNGRYSGD